MDYKELIKKGDLDNALKELKEEIRKKPGNNDLRVFLCQLLCVLGDWDRANKQLQALSKMEKEFELFVQVYSQVINCEKLRASIFAGEKTPVVFGEPEPWVALIIQALSHFSKNEHSAAQELMQKALQDSPAISGTINDETFAWIADADSRLGPILEIIINGQYYWLPFMQIKTLCLEKPQDLRDLVWIPVELKLVNDTELGGFIPVRYPNSENSDDTAIKLSRKTDWLNPAKNIYFGLGQRLFATDEKDYPLLEVKRVTMNP